MIELFTGPTGSGKSVLLNKRMISKAVNGRKIAVNYEFNDQGYYHALRRNGMLHVPARDVVNSTIIIRTYEQLRGLKNTWLGLDEAHFWFFARMWERISLQDVQFWSLSRKLGVDVSLVSQRKNSIDSIVRDLVHSTWSARPLYSTEVKQFPFNLALNSRNWLIPSGKWLGMFLYTKEQDINGSTREQRKTMMGSVAAKSLCVLDRFEARVYDTGRFFTSPLIEEDVRQQKVKFLRAVFLGELIPLQTCSCCGGLGRASFEFHLDDLQGGLWVPDVARRVDREHELASESECPMCSGSGHFSNPSSDDLVEARTAALAGLLGPDCKAQALGVAPAAPARGGWAAKKGVGRGA